MISPSAVPLLLSFSGVRDRIPPKQFVEAPARYRPSQPPHPSSPGM